MSKLDSKSNETKTNEIIKQFYIDMPRLDLFLEGSKCDKEPEYVKDYLYKNLNKDEALVAIYTLTQTFLADYYISEFRKLICTNGQQLLDNKNYIVHIDTKKKLVHVSKEFKIVYFSEDKTYIVDFCTLNIHIYLENLKVLYSWNYEFEIDQPLVIETTTLEALT
jgi:hypothetical protein